MSRPAFIEQHITGFFGRGMLAAETPGIVTERTCSGAANSSSITCTDAQYFIVGGTVSVQHSNGYSSHFVTAKSGDVIGVAPPLPAAASRIERLWFNQAHAGEFYMRQLAQRIARATEFDAAMPDGNRILRSYFGSMNSLSPCGTGVINFYPPSNVGDNGTATPVRFGPDWSAHVSNILDADQGCQTPLYPTNGVSRAIVRLAFMDNGTGATFRARVTDQDGNVIAEHPLSGGTVQRIYQFAADIRRATHIKVQVISSTYVAGSYFALGQLEVFEAPSANGKVISNPYAKIVVLGDSWAAGDSTTPERESICTQLAIELPYATIINAGVGGNTVLDLLARFDSDVAPHRPDYVVICTGTNDCYSPASHQFSPNATDLFLFAYSKLLGKIASIGARPIILGVPALAESSAEFTNFALNDRAKGYAHAFHKWQGG